MESNINFFRTKERLPKHWTRVDICNYFGYPRSLSLADIFRRKNYVYVPVRQNTGLRDAQPVYLQEVNGGVEQVDSLKKFCREVLLLGGGSDKNVVLNYVRNKYLIKYDNRLFIASLTPNVESPNLYRGFDENPYSMLKIRQTMREIGLYNDSILTLGEICEWCYIDSSSSYVRRQLCDFFGVAYVASHFSNGYRRPFPCSFRNLETNVVENFSSLSEAGVFFDFHPSIVKKYFLGRNVFHNGDVSFQSTLE